MPRVWIHLRKLQKKKKKTFGFIQILLRIFSKHYTLIYEKMKCFLSTFLRLVANSPEFSFYASAFPSDLKTHVLFSIHSDQVIKIHTKDTSMTVFSTRWKIFLTK